jgi:hypothetical protein
MPTGNFVLKSKSEEKYVLRVARSIVADKHRWQAGKEQHCCSSVV